MQSITTFMKTTYWFNHNIAPMLYNVKSSEVKVKFHEFLVFSMCVDNTQLQAPPDFSSVYMNSFSPATCSTVLEGSLGKLEARRTSKQSGIWIEAITPLLRG